MKKNRGTAFSGRNLMALAFFLALTALLAAPCAADDAPTLAVLNFTNRNPGDGWDWLGKGLPDMLITDLSVSDQLQLVTREDMQALFDEMRLGATGAVTADSAQRFGQTMRAEFVLTGTFAQHDGALTVEAHVVEIADQKVRRVEVVAGRAADALKLEKDLALNIVRNFNLPLSEAERALLLRMPTQSIDAGKRFYEGLNAYDLGQPLDAIAAIRQALEKDAAFSRARFELGRVYRGVLEFDHAEIEFIRLATQYPDSPFAPDALLGRAKIKEKFSQVTTSEVIAFYDEVARRYPQSDVALPSRFRAAILAYQSDYLDKAQALFAGLEKVNVHCYAPGRGRMIPYARMCLKEIEKEKTNPKPPVKKGQLSNEINARIRLEPKKGEQNVKLHKYSLGKPNREVSVVIEAPEGFAIMALMPGPGPRVGDWKMEAFRPDGRSILTQTPKSKPVRNRPPPILPPPPAVVVRISTGSRPVPLEVNALVLPFKRSGRQDDKVPVEVAHGLLLKRPLPRVYRIDSPENTTGRLYKECVTLAPMEGGAYYPCMAQDRSGHFWLVFNDQCDAKLAGSTGGDADIWIAESKDGQSWTDPVRLPVNSDGHDLHPWLIVDDERRFRLFWSSMRRGNRTFEVLTSVSRDGHAWSAPRVCNIKYRETPRIRVDKEREKEIVRGVYCPRAVQDRDERFWMTYLSFRGDPGSLVRDAGLANLVASDDGYSWKEVKEIRAAGTGGPISLIESGAGALYIAAIWDSQLMVATTGTENTNGKEYPTGLSRYDHNWPNLSVDCSGTLYLADAVRNRGMAVRASRDGKRWGEARFVGPGGGNKGAPFLFHDTKGNHWLIWASPNSHAINQSIHLMKVPLPSP